MHLKKEPRERVIRHKLWGVICIASVLMQMGTVHAQAKYLVIKTDESSYRVVHHTLFTKDLYGLDKKIELYNIMYPSSYPNKRNATEENLILFSALPNLDDDNGDWTEVDFDEIKNDTVDFGTMNRLFQKNSLMLFNEKYGDQTKYFNDYKPVVEKAGKYYVPAFCLLQFYAIRNRPNIFANVFGTINIAQEPISILDFEQVYRQVYPSEEFPLYTLRSSVYSSNFDRLRDRREYLSGTVKLEDQSVGYRFWTYTDWHEHTHAYEIDRGIDRFVYVPEKGIVGGSYDFYFYHHRKKLGLSHAFFIENIKQEKLMFAK